MFSLNRQFFCTYAVMGAVLPFLPVFLDERGLSRTQIGYVIGAAALGLALTPVIVTLLADAAVSGRLLMSGIFALSGMALVAMLPAQGFWPIFALYAAHALLFAPTTPLQDGLYFTEQHRRSAAGLRVVPYHIVRVWGTFGYILPSVILYFFLEHTATVTPAITVGACFCLAGLVNALTLPRTAPAARDSSESRLPTIAAARAMLEPHVLVFCIAMFLTHMMAAAYYQFYPLHLTDRVGIDKKWVGLIAMIGVVVEIPFMIGFGYLVHRLTLRRFMAIAALAAALRMGLLGWSTTIGVAIGTQALHGVMALLIHVAPPIYLNRRAGHGYRNSMQGLYTVVVLGVGRMCGSLIAGHIAEVSLRQMFFVGGSMVLVAAVLFHFAFRDHVSDEPQDAPAEQPVPASAANDP